MTILWQFANTKSQCFVYSGKMEAMRESWTDDRMDDLARRVDAGFAQVHEDVAALRVDNTELRQTMHTLDGERRAEMGLLASRRELHTEVSSLRAEMRERFDKVDERFDKVDSRFEKVDERFEHMLHRFDALNGRFDALQRTLIAAILAGFITLLATHFA